MNISSAQYIQQPENPGVNISIKMVLTNGRTWCVPITADNKDYQAILDWVAEGNTIADAD